MDADDSLDGLTEIGRYRLLRVLGQGALGRVWAAHDPLHDREVAVKLLSQAFTESADFRECYRLEAQALVSLAHPHVIAVHELGAHDGQPFVAMELASGPDCRRVVEDGPVPIDRVCRWLREAALGLGAAAERGLVHRDVRPAHLLLHHDRVKVTGFGLVRTPSAASSLTPSSQGMGTPGFMSPEQAMGRPLDARSDLYSLGMTAFYLLTGRPAFVGDVSQVLFDQLTTPLPDPRLYRADVPAPLVELLQQLTQKQPDARLSRHDEAARRFGAHAEPEVGVRAVPGALKHAGGPLADRQVALPMGDFVVGRAPECNLILDSGEASRRHAIFTRSGASLLVRDLQSRNGVFVNGAQVSEQVLQVGDQVRIGTEAFVVAAAAGVKPATMGVARAELATRMSLLRDLSRAVALGAEFPLERLGQVATGTLLPLRRLTVVVLRRGGEQRTAVHAARTPADQVEPLQALVEHCLARRALVYMPDANQETRFTFGPSPVATALCTPLLSPEGVVTGVLYADATDVQAVGAEEQAWFESLGLLAGAALARRPADVGLLSEPLAPRQQVAVVAKS
jgi:hypothetical protein